MQRNVINLGGDPLLYRVFSWKRFCQALSTNRLTLVRPSKWDDPFENLLENIKATMRDGHIANFKQIAGRFYGQCWTQNRESDAMWRIYAPCKDGIKVTVKLNKLFSYLYDTTNKFCALSFFIGKVKYFSGRQLKELLGGPGFLRDHLDSEGSKLAEMLLFKRKEFSHEREVRLLFCAPADPPEDHVKNKWYDAEEIFHLMIDPNDLFREVVFDPRMSKELYADRADEVRSLGYTGRITQSSLYHPSTFMLRF